MGNMQMSVHVLFDFTAWFTAWFHLYRYLHSQHTLYCVCAACRPWKLDVPLFGTHGRLTLSKWPLVLDQLMIWWWCCSDCDTLSWCQHSGAVFLGISLRFAYGNLVVVIVVADHCWLLFTTGSCFCPRAVCRVGWHRLLMMYHLCMSAATTTATTTTLVLLCGSTICCCSI